MIVLSFPWHWVGLLGMPRRMAYYDYTDPSLAPLATSVILSTIGGALLVVSGLLFLLVLIRGHRAPVAALGPYRFSEALHPPSRVPVPLNGYAVWLGLMVGLTVLNYGFPIAQLVANPATNVPPVFVGAQR